MSSSAPSEPKKDEKIKPKENPELKKKWAVPVDITSPCDDFHKRIPNPAFKVTLFALVQSFLLSVVLSSFPTFPHFSFTGWCSIIS